jgi:hypothetical protein
MAHLRTGWSGDILTRGARRSVAGWPLMSQEVV